MFMPDIEPAGAGFVGFGAAEALDVAAGEALGATAAAPGAPAFDAAQPGMSAARIFIPSGMVIMPCASARQSAALAAGTAADVAPGVGGTAGVSAFAVPPAINSNPSAPAPVSSVRPDARRPRRIDRTAERANLSCLTGGPPRQAGAPTA
jgi:hypothetical protein